MKAIVYKKYGTSEALQLAEVAEPTPGPDEVLIAVKAVALNASDCEFLKGDPSYVRIWGLFKPKNEILGSDVAGTVVAIGEKVTKFKVGDAVFGDLLYKWGGLAEYVCAPEKLLIHKPKIIDFVTAAALPQAGVVAWQAIYNRVKPQQKVLINGAGGGAGTMAIQLAKYFGAMVTGIDNGQKLEIMQQMGADHVIDYTKTDFVNESTRYDLIIDFIAKRSLFDYQKVLKKGGQYLLVGGSVKRLLQTLCIGSMMSIIGSQKMHILAHEQSNSDLRKLLELHQSGRFNPIIDRTYPLADAAMAFEQLLTNQIKGKVVIII